MTGNKPPTVGETLEVIVTKVSTGKDKKIYVTISSPEFTNKPSLIWRNEDV